jgi:hypothetical protein
MLPRKSLSNVKNKFHGNGASVLYNLSSTKEIKDRGHDEYCVATRTMCHTHMQREIPEPWILASDARIGMYKHTTFVSRGDASSYCCACDAGGCPMHAQNADESLRRRLAGLSLRASLPAGDWSAKPAASGLSAMAPTEGVLLRHKQADDGSATRGEKGSSACSGGAAVGVVGADRLLRSRLRSGSSQMRPDEPCRRNDTDDLCRLDIDTGRWPGKQMLRSLSFLDGRRGNQRRARRRLFARTYAEPLVIYSSSYQGDAWPVCVVDALAQACIDVARCFLIWLVLK